MRFKKNHSFKEKMAIIDKAIEEIENQIHSKKILISCLKSQKMVEEIMFLSGKDTDNVNKKQEEEK